MNKEEALTFIDRALSVLPHENLCLIQVTVFGKETKCWRPVQTDKAHFPFGQLPVVGPSELLTDEPSMIIVLVQYTSEPDKRPHGYTPHWEQKQVFSYMLDLSDNR